MATASAHFHRRENVIGYGERRNDLLFFPNQSEISTQSVVYYFGGDIQVKRRERDR